MLALAIVAGCTGDEAAPNERRFSASGGSTTAGWAYDGLGVLGQAATLDGSTNDADNTGSASATFTMDGITWTIAFDQFAQASGKDFQDGGIEHALDEHGDTGVADASIPKIHALVAAWGSASVTRGGELVTQEPWSAHLMIAADTVRGTDGKITKADGTTPYDPATPADARRIENDPQAILWVKHPLGETFSRGAVPVAATLACQGPQCTQSAEIPAEEGATHLDINVTYTPTGPLPLAVGRATFSIVDAAGTSVVPATESQIVPGPTPTTLVVSVPLEGIVGPLTAQITGDGAFSVAIEGTITYVDHPFLVLTWDDPVVT